jgi:hypothetical protein
VQPKVTSANRLLSFDLSKGFRASLFGDIGAEGAIQYHYLLVVYSPDTNPILFVGSEWNAAVPFYKDEPVLGVFTGSGHHNLGNSATWRDPHLFALRAIEVAREELQIGQGPLTNGEAWALTQMMKWLNQNPGDRSSGPQWEAYWSALSRNDGRLVAFLPSAAEKDVSRDDERMAASFENVVRHEGTR